VVSDIQKHQPLHWRKAKQMLREGSCDRQRTVWVPNESPERGVRTKLGTIRGFGMASALAAPRPGHFLPASFVGVLYPLVCILYVLMRPICHLPSTGSWPSGYWLFGPWRSAAQAAVLSHAHLLPRPETHLLQTPYGTLPALPPTPSWTLWKPKHPAHARLPIPHHAMTPSLHSSLHQSSIAPPSPPIH